MLTDEQKLAVETSGSVAVIASAGTGKTTVLTKRFLYCHQERQASLHQLLAFTFTEKASREMMTRVLESGHVSYMNAPQLNISTIHSFCQRLLKNHGFLLGLSQDFAVYDEESHQVWQDLMISEFVSKAFDQSNKYITHFIRSYGYTHFKKTVRNLLEQGLNNIPESCLVCSNNENEVDVKGLTGFIKEVAVFQKSLLQHKIKNNIVSYDDLEILTLKLLQEHDLVLSKITNQYRHILVDEYQDISPRQYQIIKLLFKPNVNELFVVGDPKQSIYGFRGADVSLFYKTADLIKNNSGEVIYLTKTFRTPEKLQNYFNKVFTHVLSPKDFQPAQTMKKEDDSFLYVEPLPSEKKRSAERHDYYAEKIAKKVRGLIESGVKPEEIAVLFYASLAISTYQKVLQENNIKTVTQTKTHVFEVPIVLVAWQILKYLGGARDHVTQVGMLRNGVLSFSENFIDHLIKSKNTDLFENQTLDLFSHHKDQDEWTRLLSLLNRWQKLKKSLYVTELFQTIVYDLKKDLSVYEAYFVNDFLSVLGSWQSEGLYYLSQTNALIKTLGQNDSLSSSIPANPEGVQLLTIHGAKGLEFEHVFLVPGRGKNKESKLCLYDDKTGFVFKKHDAENETMLKYQLEEPETYEKASEHFFAKQTEELARLIYVALTRAKKSLYYYVEKPAEHVLKRFVGDATNTSVIKNYNEWLFWLAKIISPQDVCSEDNFNKASDNLDLFLDTEQSCVGCKDSVANIEFKKNLTHFTVTELEVYKHCPKRFELRYQKNILPIQDPKVVERRRFVSPEKRTRLKPSERGNLFHEILQYYDFKSGKNLDDVIDQALFNQHILVGSDSIRTECHLFINQLSQDPVMQLYLFQSIASEPEVAFSCELDQLILSGQVDRLVSVMNRSGEKKHVIIDYKTHHTVSEEQRLTLMDQFSFQMSCYALALSKYLNVSNIETVVLFTGVPTYKTITHTQDKLHVFEQGLNTLCEKMKQDINNQRFELTKHTTNCVNCPYFAGNYCGVKI